MTLKEREHFTKKAIDKWREQGKKNDELKCKPNAERPDNNNTKK